MRKSNTTRVALLLLALTLITSCFVGGTFAKYVTGAKIQETARVAKFGVDVTATNTDGLFDFEYETDDTATYSGAMSVVAADSKNVVAPGTKGEVLGFGITGKPEVAVKVTFEMDITDIYLKAGTYDDMTMRDYVNEKDGSYAKFTLAKDYHPLVFTLTKPDGSKVVGTAAEIKEAVNNMTAVYGPNTDLAAVVGSYTLNWEWDFESGNDAADTYLGNAKTSAEQLEESGLGAFAGSAVVDNGTYCVDVLATLKITVEQVD